MLGWFLVGGLFGLSVLLVVLRKVYIDNPSTENFVSPKSTSKSRSISSTKRENVLAAVLQLFVVFTFAVFAILLAEYLPSILAFIVISASLLYLFFVLPALNARRISVSIAGAFAPLFMSLLNKTKPQTKRLEKYLTSFQTRHNTPRKLGKYEIIELLEKQKSLSEGRTLSFELTGSINALNLIGKKVSSFMLKFDELLLVGDKESVGPIMIDELHKSNRKIFLVNNSKHGVIGTVLLKDLIDLKDGGLVEKVFMPQIEFVEAEQDVRELLEIFVESDGMIFVVTDEDGEKIGAVYIEDVIKELIRE